MTKKLLLVLALAVLLVALTATVALADHKDDAAVDPHDSYSSTTDYCLQCHDIHEAGGDYALMYQATVVDTCGTCHSVYQQAPTGPRDPGYSGTESAEPAPGSTFAVYENAGLASRYTHEGHRLSRNGNPDAGALYSYADGTTTDTADYIPGSGNTLVNRISTWPDWMAGASMAAYPASGRTATNGLYCASCHSPHGPKFGNAIASAVSNGKLLSDRPNHAQTPIDTSAWTDWVSDGGAWCASCHVNRWEPSPADGVAPHNHPSTVCLQCHGNAAGLLPDFPHTGAKNILQAEPDELCIMCHIAKSIP